MAVKIFGFIVFFLHGMAHLGGVLAPFKADKADFKNSPWIFSKSVYLVSFIGKFWGIIWLIASLGFMASAFGVFFFPGILPILISISAIYSLIAIIPWWKAIPPGAKVGLVFDITLLVFLVISERIF